MNRLSRLRPDSAGPDPGFRNGDADATLNRAESLGPGTADLHRVQIIEITV